MVFASLVFGKLRLIMFLSQSVNSSLVLGLIAVVGCSSLLSRVKPLAKGWFQLVLVSGRAVDSKPPCSCTGMEEFFFQLFRQILGHRCRIFQGKKTTSILIPSPLALT